ncbi:MAG: hypothetical protein K5989_12665 [Lachnospiraceae bacterium]|nr:hypothetical protein [Lachnospiraceae bacterium]
MDTTKYRKNDSERTEKSFTIIIWLLFLLGCAAFISLIFNRNLWVDEAFTACIIRGDWPEVWQKTAADTLPPFYNLFTKLLTVILGYCAPVMKLSSVLPMIFTMLLGATLVRKWFGSRSSILFILFIVVMPHFLYYGVEIRMYSWGIFFLTAAGIFSYPLFAHSRGMTLSSLQIASLKPYWILFALSTAFCGYTHHFALVSAAFLWLFLLISLSGSIIASNRHDRSPENSEPGIKGILLPYLLSLALFVLLYFPCLLLTIRQIKHASSYFSMTPLSLRTLLSDFRFPFVTEHTVLSAALLLMTALTVIHAVFHLLTNRVQKAPGKTGGPSVKKSASEETGNSSFSENETVPNMGDIPDNKLIKDETQIPCLFGLVSMLVLPGTILFGYAVSAVAGSSLFTARYLVPSLGLLWLGVSILSGPMLGKKLGTGLFLLWLLLSLPVGIRAYRDQYSSEYSDGVEKMIAFFDANIKPGDGYIIYENNYQIELCFRYYYPELQKYDWESADEIPGTVWYFYLDGFKKELDLAPDFGYNAFCVGDMNFDRYAFVLYRMDKDN